MQVYKGAKQLKITNKEMIAMIDRPEVNHHMDKIPDEMLEELGLVEKKIKKAEPTVVQSAPEAKAVVVEECPYTLAEIELGIRCLGNRSPCWKWRDKIG